MTNRAQVLAALKAQSDARGIGASVISGVRNKRYDELRREVKKINRRDHGSYAHAWASFAAVCLMELGEWRDE